MREEAKQDIDYTWQDQAACRGIPTNEFYPTRGEMIPQIIKEKCDICPVLEDCLNHALKHEAYGYWGGTSEKQRVAIRASEGIRLIKPEVIFSYSIDEARKRIERNREKIRGRGRKTKIV